MKEKTKRKWEEDFVTNRKWGNKLMEKGRLKGTLERETTLYSLNKGEMPTLPRRKEAMKEKTKRKWEKTEEGEEESSQNEGRLRKRLRIWYKQSSLILFVEHGVGVIV
ncbi:MAG: hypothetical protein LBD15_00080 [Holosporales bacterium]|jgi:hypothetical protein|nr:hypothetical protein [Holosporales bacterium]